MAFNGFDGVLFVDLEGLYLGASAVREISLSSIIDLDATVVSGCLINEWIVGFTCVAGFASELQCTAPTLIVCMAFSCQHTSLKGVCLTAAYLGAIMA